MFCYFNACSSVTFLTGAWKKIFNIIIFYHWCECIYLMHYIYLNCCLCLYNNTCCCLFLSSPVFAQHFSLPESWVLWLWQFASLSSLSVCIVLQLIVSMFSNSISGIPSNGFPFPGTTKKLHILHLLLCSTVTLHMPNCIIVVWLYVFSFVFYLLWLLTVPLLS